MRHHNPARRPSDDGFCGATPHNLVDPGVAVGTHYQEIDAVGLDVSLKHLSDRAAVNLHRCKTRLYAVLCEMAYKRCPGFHFRGNSEANSGQSRTGLPDPNSNPSTIFSDRPSCGLTATIDRSLSRAQAARLAGISAAASRLSVRSLRIPKRIAAAWIAFSNPCASDTVRTISPAAVRPPSADIDTFGRTTRSP